MGLTVYGMGASQPYRAILLLCEANNISYTEKLIDLRKGEQKTPEYLAINPFGKVPCIDDDGFRMAEGPAILQYLASKYKVPDHWYPADVKKRTKIDEYLHWQHTGMRKHAMEVFHDLFIYPKLYGRPVDEEKTGKDLKTLDGVFALFEKVFLSETDYISSTEINIADLCAITEIMQVIAVQPTDILANFPKLAAWKERVQKRLDAFEEIHKPLYEFIKSADKK